LRPLHAAGNLTTKEQRNEEFYFARGSVPAERRIFDFRLSAESRHAIVAAMQKPGYIIGVKSLTKQEQLFLCVVLGLLLTGWAVKTWRTAHPPAAANWQAKP
jgi:hypothetical protein